MTKQIQQQTTHPAGSRHHGGATPDRGGRHRVRTLSAVALVGMALTLAACSSSGSATASGGGSSSTTSTSQAPQSTTTTAGGAAAPTGSSAITIKNFAFSPTTVTVAPGATVTVTNKDQVAHTITAVDGKFNTGDIQPGSSKTFTAPNTAGSYPYICSIHQYMMGTLTVS
jgi:plastocyanin